MMGWCIYAVSLRRNPRNSIRGAVRQAHRHPLSSSSCLSLSVLSVDGSTTTDSIISHSHLHRRNVFFRRIHRLAICSFCATLNSMTELGIEVLEYLTEDGRNLFRTWLEALRDAEARARIRVRINRIRLGNFGDSKSVGGGVSELRIPYGPGYRVYFGRQGNRVVILLCGGDKRTQARDIETARVAWQDYVKRSTSA